jgi:hypothetical protein
MLTGKHGISCTRNYPDNSITLCRAAGSDEPDSRSQFARRESELSTEELLLPEEKTGFFLPESTAILPKSPSIYPQ